MADEYEQKKTLAIFHLKNNMSVPAVAAKLNIAEGLVQEWYNNLDEYPVTQTIEDVVSLVKHTAEKDDNYDEAVLKELKSTLGELALFCAKKISHSLHDKETATIYQIVMASISLMYKTFFTSPNTNVAIFQGKPPNDTQISHFTDLKLTQ